MGIPSFFMFAIVHTAQNFEFRLASPARYPHTSIGQETLMTLQQAKHGDCGRLRFAGLWQEA